MRFHLLIILIGVLTFSNCGGVSSEAKEVNVNLYLAGPHLGQNADKLSGPLLDLLRPLRCEEESAGMSVKLIVTRLDLDPVTTTEVIVPLTWINSMRDLTETFTFENEETNYESNKDEVPVPDILTRDTEVTADLSALQVDELYYCCGSAPGVADVRESVVRLEQLPEILAALSCDKELEDGHQINYLLLGGEAPVPSPLFSSSPAPAAAPQKDLQIKIATALNTIGDRNESSRNRYDKIASVLELFSEDAHVMVYGDNGTLVANKPIAGYLEAIAGYLTVDSIYVDEALTEDGLCWQLRLRETHQ